MSGLVEQLMLAEKAAENIYFAKVNRELIERLHKQQKAAEAAVQRPDPALKNSRAPDRAPE